MDVIPGKETHQTSVNLEIFDRLPSLLQEGWTVGLDNQVPHITLYLSLVQFRVHLLQCVFVFPYLRLKYIDHGVGKHESFQPRLTNQFGRSFHKQALFPGFISSICKRPRSIARVYDMTFVYG